MLEVDRFLDALAAGIAEPTYAAWMGHAPRPPRPSRVHDVAPTQAEYDVVTASVPKSVPKSVPNPPRTSGPLAVSPCQL